MKKDAKISLIAVSGAICLFLAMIPIYLLFSKVLDVKVDLTPNKTFSLSDTATEQLKNLQHDINIYVLYDMDDYFMGDDGKRAEPGDIVYTKADLLTECLKQISAYDKVNINEYDIVRNPDLAKKLDPEGLMGIKEGDIVLECGEVRRCVIPSQLYARNEETENLEFYGESYFMGAIEYLDSQKIPTVYLASGHGSVTADKYSLLGNLLKSQNYALKEIDLTSEGSVPEDALTVVYAAPKEDITDHEKDLLLDYAKQGGNLIMLLSPNAKEIKYENIEEVLGTYKIGIDYNKVYETQSDLYAPDDKYTIMCNFVDNDFTKAISKTSGGLPLYMTPSRSFYSTKSADDTSTDIVVTPLIETNSSAKSEICGGIVKDANELSGILYLAANAEDTTRNGSKLLVMGSAEFMTDEVMEKGYTILTPYIFLQSVSWMEGTTFTYPTRVHSNDYISVPDKKTGNILLVIIIVYPILIASTGVIVWLRRRNA